MKIICVGRNYVAHARELNNDIPREPVLFMKPATALVRSPAQVYIPDFTKDLHYEAELVLRIEKNGKHIAPNFAHRYYSHISVGIDFTARDVQEDCKTKGLPWEKAKAFDQSAVIGTWKSMAELPSKDNISFSLSKNNLPVQMGDSAQMLFSFDAIIHYISLYFTLQTGDLIFTGTPAGVGPVSVGDILEGFLMDEKVLSIKIC